MRTYHLLRGLAARHEVRQFSLARRRSVFEPPVDADTEVGPRYRERRYGGRIAGLLTEISERCWVSAPVLAGAALGWARHPVLDAWLEWADVVLVEFPWMFEYCRRRTRGRIVLSAHNVEADKFASYADASPGAFARGAWLRWIASSEEQAVRNADRIVTVSDADRETLISRFGLDADRVVVAPNGADVDTYRPTDDAEREREKRRLGLPAGPVVLFAGADVPPNRVGLKWVESAASATADFTFLVVGSVARPGRRGSLVATGPVDDFGSYLRASDFSLCPIRHGGGTIIKLLESLAAGLPTVAFAEALRGLRVADGEHVVVAAPRTDAILDGLSRLARESEAAKRIGANAADYVKRHHAWSASAEILESALVAACPSA